MRIKLTDEEKRENRKEYLLKNTARRKEMYRKNRLKNKEKIKIQRHNEYNNRDKAEKVFLIAKQKEWKKKNPEKYKIIQKRYKDKHKDKARKYMQFRYHNDIKYKIRMILSGRIRNAIKSGKTTKRNQTIVLLGCQIPEAMHHLEQQFREGMTWKSHGSIWEIDHILPCSGFKLTDPKQQLLCFNYKNLQPLYKYENREKRDKSPEIWEAEKLNTTDAEQVKLSQPIQQHETQT